MAMPAAASALLETVNLPTLLFIGTLLPARLEKGISFTLQGDWAGVGHGFRVSRYNSTASFAGRRWLLSAVMVISQL